MTIQSDLRSYAFTNMQLTMGKVTAPVKFDDFIGGIEK
jgi:hypothetical protein